MTADPKDIGELERLLASAPGRAAIGTGARPARTVAPRPCRRCGKLRGDGRPARAASLGARAAAARQHDGGEEE